MGLREPSPRKLIELNPEVLDDVRDRVRELDVPGTPSVRDARLLKAAGLPFWAGTRHVRGVNVADGRPMHGEMRSDDHVSRFDVELPLSEIDTDALDDDLDVDHGYVEDYGRTDKCPECGHHRALYVLSATHNIAGWRRVRCARCDEMLFHQSWG